MSREVPIFFFLGMLESGKTTMIRSMLENPKLTNGRKILLLLCEEGIEEFDPADLKKKNIVLETVEEETDYDAPLFKELDKKHRPDYIIVEYNGMWSPERMIGIKYPAGYGIAEIMMTVDSSTYPTYLANMRPMFAAMYRLSDMVVFNRFENDDLRISYRAGVKAQNMQAQVAFEYTDGHIDMNFDQSPFDLEADKIDIGDADWGLWYFDAMEQVQRYHGKEITALVRAVRFGSDRQTPMGTVVGRVGMTCCADDQQFLGIIVVKASDEALEHTDLPEGAWMKIRAGVFAADGSIYGEDPTPPLPVLEVYDFELCPPPEEEVVGI